VVQVAWLTLILASFGLLAPPLLLAGYAGLKQREAKILANRKARLIQALEWLVQLYEAWSRKDKADRWRKRLEVRQAAAKSPARPS
jgi:hypothetical protein